MSKHFEISEPMARQWRREYENGDNTTVLAKRYKTTKATVARNIRRVGGELRPDYRRRTMPVKGLLGWINS